jgi:hypothetical protein
VIIRVTLNIYGKLSQETTVTVNNTGPHLTEEKNTKNTFCVVYYQKEVGVNVVARHSGVILNLELVKTRILLRDMGVTLSSSGLFLQMDRGR